ncbi:hypothetical protein [Candidatus Collinsella stercoripullorum]|uniref:hypothetical protein n=1 Tax=Candidatus Collinsella stercoripullorum TaxID=2838522 RepID=UPI0022E78BFA|nr:hypothetical protein [Candidatus Collinsella stercoripullorum]
MSFFVMEGLRSVAQGLAGGYGNEQVRGVAEPRLHAGCPRRPSPRRLLIAACYHTRRRDRDRRRTKKPGNTEYWTCGVCDKIFSDGAGEHEIALDNTVVPATGHSWGEDGHCAACDAVDPDFTPAIIVCADATWQKGSGKDLAFTSNAAYGDFMKVLDWQHLFGRF